MRFFIVHHIQITEVYLFGILTSKWPVCEGLGVCVGVGVFVGMCLAVSVCKMVISEYYSKMPLPS